MKNLTILIAVFLTIRPAMAGPNDFFHRYEVFRFGLHESMGSISEPRLTSELNLAVHKFLEENASDIVRYRTAQLERYEREIVHDRAEYSEIDAGLFSQIEESLVWLNPRLFLEQAGAELQPDPEKLVPFRLTELLAVDPFYLLYSTASQISISILNRRDMGTEALTAYYTRSAIGGTFISTEKLRGNSWKITMNSYDIISEFTFDAESAETKLTRILTRNGQ